MSKIGQSQNWHLETIRRSLSNADILDSENDLPSQKQLEKNVLTPNQLKCWYKVWGSPQTVPKNKRTFIEQCQTSNQFPKRSFLLNFFSKKLDILLRKRMIIWWSKLKLHLKTSQSLLHDTKKVSGTDFASTKKTIFHLPTKYLLRKLKNHFSREYNVSFTLPQGINYFEIDVHSKFRIEKDWRTHENSTQDLMQLFGWAWKPYLRRNNSSSHRATKDSFLKKSINFQISWETIVVWKTMLSKVQYRNWSL